MYLDSMNKVLDFIEKHLTDDISYHDIASMMAMSVYELRRIFAFVIGTPLSDYIRKRRLSSAMFDLQSSDASITDIALKYRYDSPSSFSRAFREMQGVSPTEARNDGVLLRSFPRASLTFSVAGASGISFRLVRRGEMRLRGFSGISDGSSSDCGENVWNAYFDGGYHDRLLKSGAFSHENAEFAAYVNTDGPDVGITIGALLALDSDTVKGMDELRIPPSLWGIFDVVGTMNDQISAAYYKTVAEWLEDSSYERSPEVCNLEAFPVEDRVESETMRWQIWYPLKEKRGKTPDADQ